MRYYDQKEAQELNAKQWMLDLLKMNPSYISWGPGEDGMHKIAKKGEHSWWADSVEFESWGEFGPWALDDLNEVVHFYFEVNRESEKCETCIGRGIHPDAQWVTESWYKTSSPFTKPDAGEIRGKALMATFGCEFNTLHGRGTFPPDAVVARYGKPFLDFCVRTMERGGHWGDDITQDEVDALWESGRLKIEFPDGKPTAEQVNARSKTAFILHDSINSWICCKTRCERLGMPYLCTVCDGNGYTYTAPSAHVNVVLWMLHPRKSCGRGLRIRITQEDLPAVFAFLRSADERSRERFSMIPVQEGRKS